MVTSRTLGFRRDARVIHASAGQAIVLAALALGLAGDLLFRAWPVGLNATIWLSGVALAALVIPRFQSLDVPQQRGAVWLWAAVGFSLMLLWRASPVLQALNVTAIFLCLGMVAFRPTAGALRLAGNSEYVANFAISAVQMAIGMMALLDRHVDWQALFGSGRSPRFIALARGLALATVPIVVFAALFASADVFFRHLLQDVLFISPADAISHLGMWFIFAWLAGSYLWGALLAEREPLPALPRVAWLRFEFIEMGVVLGLVDALFLAFVTVQFRYLFGGAGRVEASSSLTYAEYARRGFFELVAVAGLSVLFLLMTHWLLPRDNGRLQRFYSVLAGLLILLVFIVMASALQRMRLYQETFGLTELRVYTTAFMAWMFAVICWLGFTVLRAQRDRFAFGTVLAGLLVVIGLNLANPDAIIIRRNAAIAGSERLFDSEYALGLSSDGVPALIANFDEVAPADRCQVARELRRRYLAAVYDWRTWNWGRIRARDAVSSSDSLDAACEAAVTPTP